MQLMLLKTHRGDPGHWAVWDIRTGAIYLCFLHKKWYRKELIKLVRMLLGRDP